MGPIQANFRETKVEADPCWSTTSAHLRGRARQYRLAAAVADCPRDELMFCDMAMMFDQLAYQFRRFENTRHRAPARNQTTNHRGPDGCSTGWRDWPRAEIEWIAGLPGCCK